MQILLSALHSDPKIILHPHESQKCLANYFVIFSQTKSPRLGLIFQHWLFLHAPLDLCKFDFFKTFYDEEIHKAMMKSQTKSSLLDPWPTFLFKECFDILLSSITKLVNCSFSEGVLPTSLKKSCYLYTDKKSLTTIWWFQELLTYIRLVLYL